MAELIDVFDSEGNKTEIIKTKAEVHREGLWHRAIHIWFINSKNEILLQFRSALMSTNPNSWDMSVAGHVSSGEDLYQAAQREIKEEIGLDFDPSKLKQIGEIKVEKVHKEGAYINKEFDFIYRADKDLEISELRLQVEEVTAVKWVPIPEFVKWIKEGRADLAPHPEGYAVLLKELGL